MIKEKENVIKIKSDEFILPLIKIRLDLSFLKYIYVIRNEKRIVKLL